MKSGEVHVLICAKAFPPNLGGLETYSEEVAFAYARAGFRPTVLTQFNGPVGTALRAQGNDLIEVINVGPGSQLRTFFRMLIAIGRLKRQRKFAFVHATTWRVAIPPVISNIRPLLLSVIGREVTHAPGVFRPLMRIVAGMAERIAVISNYTLRACEQFIPGLRENAVVCWCGVSSHTSEWRRGSQGPSKPFRIFTACRLVKRKNVGAALKAVAVLIRKRRQVEIRISGDGPDRRELDSLVATLGIAEHVQFLGHISQEELAAQYMSADLFLHPQTLGTDARDFEGFCIAIADAMAMGLPVIAGRHGGPQDYVENGVNGWLVEGNDIGEIVEVVETLMDRPELVTRVGAAASQFARSNFSWDKHIARLLPRAD